MNLVNRRYLWVYVISAVVVVVAFLCYLIFGRLTGSHKNDMIDIAREVADIASRDECDSVYARRFKAYVSQLPADSVIYNMVWEYSKDMMFDGRQATVFDMLSRLIRMCENDSDDPERRRFVLNSYVMVGAASDEIGMFNLSTEYYARGIRLADEFHDEHALAKLYNNLGVCYFHMDDMDKSAEYFTKALHINKRLGHNYDVFLNHNNLSEVALRRNQLDEALDNALLALQYLDAVDNKNKLATGQVYYIQSHIANIYLKKGDWHMARSYLDNAIRQLRKTGPKSDLFQSCMIYSDMFRQRGELDSALVWCQEAYDVIDGEGNLFLESEALKRLSALERENGNDTRSLQYLDSAFTLRDSIQQAENRNRMEQSQKIWEVERRNAGNTSFLARQNPVTVFIVFSMIVVVLIFFMIKWTLDKRKLVRTLKTKRELDEKIADMHEQQMAEAKRKQEELKQSLDLSHRQLTAFTMQKIRFSEQQNDILEDVRRLFADSSSRSKELQGALQRIISKLSGYKANDDWTEFRYYFENVNSGFYANLTKAHPDLTERQKRLCALLFLGLNTKEIAQITFREVRSIESSRTRLRKKLGLSGEEDLNVYFQRFSSDYEGDKIGEQSSPNQ